MPKNTRKGELDSLRRTLREKGLRATPARIAVLRLLRRADRPLSHADVAASLTGNDWNRSTIYRILIDLVETELALKTELGDHVWRFMDAATHAFADHPHFICTECGKVECLSDTSVSVTPGRRGPRGIGDCRIDVQLRGCCDDCR